jgi:hypothetical protein
LKAVPSKRAAFALHHLRCKHVNNRCRRKVSRI